MSFFSDLFSGNLGAVEHDITASVSRLPIWAQTLVTTLESDAGQLLNAAVTTAAQDVIKNGLTTVSFTTAAKDVAAQLTAQGTAMSTQLIYSALNAAVDATNKPATDTPTPSA